jgi:hypothetical protein
MIRKVDAGGPCALSSGSEPEGHREWWPNVLDAVLLVQSVRGRFVGASHDLLKVLIESKTWRHQVYDSNSWLIGLRIREGVRDAGSGGCEVTGNELDDIVIKLHREDSVHNVEGVLLGGVRVQRYPERVVHVEHEEIEASIVVPTAGCERSVLVRPNDPSFHLGPLLFAAGSATPR